MARKIFVSAHPYADTTGEIEIPDDVKDKDIREYVDKHFNDIKFGPPELDYGGTDYELTDEETDKKY